MKKIVILSGKGGTGKTTVAASLINLTKSRAFADCDVDAPNLHLALASNSNVETKDFYGSSKASVDSDKCIGCGKCINHCRFEAIKMDNHKAYVDEIACEGCGVCEYVCPSNAIDLKEDLAGIQYLYEDEYLFSSAKLKMGRGNSGKLVSGVKKALVNKVTDEKLIIVDGSPGIGCPVLASMQGMDFVLVVAEASVSGISDCKRLIETAQNLDIPLAVCVNKWDVSFEKTMSLMQYCALKQIPFIGKIPYDKQYAKAIRENLPVDTDSKALKAIKEIYQNIIELLEVNDESSSLMRKYL